MKYIPKFQKGKAIGTHYLTPAEMEKEKLKYQSPEWQAKASGRAEVTESPIDYAIMLGVTGIPEMGWKAATSIGKKIGAANATQLGASAAESLGSFVSSYLKGAIGAGVGFQKIIKPLIDEFAKYQSLKKEDIEPNMKHNKPIGPMKYKKGGSSKNWIQKAVNPAHKGYCTPMTKATCTPKRKALARTFKKMAKKEMGGQVASKIEKKPAGSYNTIQSYKDGTDNKRNAPKYANAAKCGKKLVKKKVDGGNVSPSKSTEPMVHSELVKHLEKVTLKKDVVKKHKKGGTINLDNILALWKK